MLPTCYLRATSTAVQASVQPVPCLSLGPTVLTLLTGLRPSAGATNRACAVSCDAMVAGQYAPRDVLLAGRALLEPVQDDVPWRSYARILVHVRLRAVRLGEVQPV